MENIQYTPDFIAFCQLVYEDLIRGKSRGDRIPVVAAVEKTREVLSQLESDIKPAEVLHYLEHAGQGARLTRDRKEYRVA